MNCKFCQKAAAKYSCPRCNCSYCSLPCYQVCNNFQLRLIYSRDLNLDKSGIWMVEIRSVYKWFRFQMGSEIQNPDHLKTTKMAVILSSLFVIWIFQSWFWMVGTILVAILNFYLLKTLLQSPDSESFQISNGWFLDPHCEKIWLINLSVI